MGDPRVYDCIVVGIGGHGSASLAYLAKSGLKVLGLEQFKPVHKHGRFRPNDSANSPTSETLELFCITQVLHMVEQGFTDRLITKTRNVRVRSVD